MNIYTKGGDRGTTSLIHTKNISKSDDRIQLVGTIDELTSHLGLIKSILRDERAGKNQETEAVSVLEEIQTLLITVMAGVADPYKKDYRIDDGPTEKLEKEIDRLEASFDRPKQFILPGSSRLSAEIDIARTVARRAERALAVVSVKFGADNGAKKLMNRLADYLYVLARYEDAKEAGQIRGGENTPQTRNSKEAGETVEVQGIRGNGKSEEAVILEVLKRMGVQGKVTLEQAKKLIGIIEEEAERRGKKAVIAVCGPDGNPIAVHVMDGAFLVSFDVAVKKAYTSVAVKMSTMELSALAQPGGTFYGLDKMEGGNIIIFGGGIPIKVGDTIIGGLGVSGGTGEEDHSLAEYGLSRLQEIL